MTLERKPIGIPARDFNVEAVKRGDLTPDMLEFLVRAGQKRVSVEVDGKAGPETRAAILAAIVENRQHPRPPTPPPEPAPPPTLGMRALACAIADIGEGEQDGNNVGPYISELRAEIGMPWSKGPWCAVAVSAWLIRGAEPDQLPFLPSPSALTLFQNAANSHGARLITLPEPGALICWVRRNKLGLKSGHHIALIETVEVGPQGTRLSTVDGNKTARGQRFAFVDRFPHPQDSWKKDLVGMVALP